MIRRSPRQLWFRREPGFNASVGEQLQDLVAGTGVVFEGTVRQHPGQLEGQRRGDIGIEIVDEPEPQLPDRLRAFAEHLGLSGSEALKHRFGVVKEALPVSVSASGRLL